MTIDELANLNWGAIIGGAVTGLIYCGVLYWWAYCPRKNDSRKDKGKE